MRPRYDVLSLQAAVQARHASAIIDGTDLLVEGMRVAVQVDNVVAIRGNGRNEILVHGSYQEVARDLIRRAKEA